VDNAAENGSDALDGVFNALLEADPISNQFEIAAMNIEYDFGLKAEDVATRASRATTTAMPALCWWWKPLPARHRTW
jgi:hypothetical protein